MREKDLCGLGAGSGSVTSRKKTENVGGDETVRGIRISAFIIANRANATTTAPTKHNP